MSLSYSGECRYLCWAFKQRETERCKYMRMGECRSSVPLRKFKFNIHLMASLTPLPSHSVDGKAQQQYIQIMWPAAIWALNGTKMAILVSNYIVLTPTKVDCRKCQNILDFLTGQKTQIQFVNSCHVLKEFWVLKFPHQSKKAQQNKPQPGKGCVFYQTKIQRHGVEQSSSTANKFRNMRERQP